MYPYKEYPKVLIISDATWADTNNIGNTFSNLFSHWPKDKIAMLYARADLPDTEICDTFFQISETRLIKKLTNFNVKTGKKIITNEKKNANDLEIGLKNDELSGRKIYTFFKKYRWNIFLIAREVLWKLGNWKTIELDNFISSYKPDVILSLACSNIYMNNLQQYVIKKSNKKSVVYFVDDVYSAKRFSISPFFWLHKMFTRRSIRKTVELCDLVYTIIPKQKKEYDEYFHIESKILNKGGVFHVPLNQKYELNSPLKFIYTGNIYEGRWETLVKIGVALDKINVNGERALLYIYTRNKLYSNIKKAFNSCKSICFMGSIPPSKVDKIQESADILVHVESLKLKEKLKTRLSFSTKLVDYFKQGKCIFAVGWSKAASIDYLRKNKAAIVVDDLDKLQLSLESIISNPELIKEYGTLSWRLGEKNHQGKEIQRKLFEDLRDLSAK